MKIRITIMTENDEHLEGVPKEKIERIAKAGWDLVLDSMGSENDDAYVESCELIEM